MEDKRYYAFISYNSADEFWARWLHCHLENYVIPTKLCKKYNCLPRNRKIRPIFKYTEDLSGTTLLPAIRKELTASKYLILICSKESAKSPYVNYEVNTFIELGKQDNILLFVVDKVNSTAEIKQCFPSNLRDLPREKELRSIILRKVGKTKAFCDIVATLFGLPFNEIYDRYHRRQIRHRVYYGILLLLLFLIGVFVWDYNRSTYKYFADYVDCYGVPEGIIPLTEEQVSHRYRSYQFEYKRIPFGEPHAYSWRLVNIKYVNSSLIPSDYLDVELIGRAVVQEFDYNKETGHISRTSFCGKNGFVKLRYVYSDNNKLSSSVVDIVDAQEQRGVGFIGNNTVSMLINPMSSKIKSNIVRIVYERDSKGHIVKQSYFSNNDYQFSSITCDANGVYGEVYTLDSLGRIIKKKYIGRDGNDVPLKTGIKGKVYKYDKYGNIALVMNTIDEKEIALNEKLWAARKATSDENGNPYYYSYVGCDGMPCIMSDGFSWLYREFDSNGNITKTIFGDTCGKATIGKQGYSIVSNKYDRRGNIIESSFFDEECKPCLINGCYFSRKFRYDNDNNLVEIAYYDDKDILVASDNGYAKISWKYEKNNMIEENTYDERGMPCLNKNGYSKTINTFDEYGNIIRVVYYGINNMPCMTNQGYSMIERKYDRRDNCYEESYYNQNGVLCNNSMMYSKSLWEYEANGRVKEHRVYNEKGEPCVNDDGYYRKVFKYDERGLLTRVENYNVNDSLCINRLGYAICEVKYNAKCECIEQVFYDTKGKQCLLNHLNGYAKICYEYDSRGNIIKTTFMGSDGLVRNNDYAYFCVKYDKRDNVIEEVYYDKKENLYLNKEGYARKKIKRDDIGDIIEVLLFDNNDNLRRTEDAIIKIDYNKRREVIEIRHYDYKGIELLNMRGKL